MTGACSNQIVKCIVYTKDIETGKQKLLEIENDKNSKGIKTVFKRFGKVIANSNQIIFDDGEEWIILSPTDVARGYRYRKAWIDTKTTTIYDLRTHILPYGDMYKWEDERYFNY